jgi:CRP-like cAMP-binding protein
MNVHSFLTKVYNNARATRNGLMHLCNMHSTIRNHIQQHIKPSAKELLLFTNTLNKITLKRGQFLLSPGVHVKHEYFVVLGCLKAYYMDANGHKHIIQFAIENWWIGDFDAFHNEVPSKLYIEAIEDVELLSIHLDALQKVYLEAPIFERYFRILTMQAFIAQRKRILSALEKSTKERYFEFCHSYPNIKDRVTNYSIANYLGVSPENLSRVRKNIKS